MTAIFRFNIMLLFGLFSCSGGDISYLKQGTGSVDTSHISPIKTAIEIVDTIQRFTVDDYPVTDSMLEDTTSKSSSYPKHSGPIHSSDKAWFKNEGLIQSLVFEIYTDMYRVASFLFYNNDIPNAIIDRMELNTADGELAGFGQKKKHFEGFVETAKSIGGSYFTTEKGLKLGDRKEKAMRMYGKPDTKSTEGSFEITEWNFVGDNLYDGKTDLKGKPLAKDNYGHQVTMIFKKNKLVAMILHNDIP